jgi:DNA polymerase I
MSEQLIVIEHDGSFQAIMTFDKKSYVLKDWNNKIKIRGQTLKGRSLEPFARTFLSRCIDRLFDDTNVTDIYEEYKLLIELRLMDVSDIAKTSTLNESLESYKNSVAANKNKNKSAVYELALASNRKYEKGDQLSYYLIDPPLETVIVRKKEVTRPMKLKAFEAARPVKEYQYDYDIKHYLDRLHKTAKRLLPVLREEGFKVNFPDIKLTPKDYRKLETMNTDDESDEDEN